MDLTELFKDHSLSLSNLVDSVPNSCYEVCQKVRGLIDIRPSPAQLAKMQFLIKKGIITELFDSKAMRESHPLEILATLYASNSLGDSGLNGESSVKKYLEDLSWVEYHNNLISDPDSGSAESAYNSSEDETKESSRYQRFTKSAIIIASGLVKPVIDPVTNKVTSVSFIASNHKLASLEASTATTATTSSSAAESESRAIKMFWNSTLQKPSVPKNKALEDIRTLITFVNDYGSRRFAESIINKGTKSRYTTSSWTYTLTAEQLKQCILDTLGTASEKKISGVLLPPIFAEETQMEREFRMQMSDFREDLIKAVRAKEKKIEEKEAIAKMLEEIRKEKSNKVNLVPNSNNNHNIKPPKAGNSNGSTNNQSQTGNANGDSKGRNNNNSNGIGSSDTAPIYGPANGPTVQSSLKEFRKIKGVCNGFCSGVCKQQSWLCNEVEHNNSNIFQPPFRHLFLTEGEYNFMVNNARLTRLGLPLPSEQHKQWLFENFIVSYKDKSRRGAQPIINK